MPCTHEQKIKDLQTQLDKLKECCCSEWPAIGNDFWFFNGSGICRGEWKDWDNQRSIRDFLGIYRTEQEAKQALAVLKVLWPGERWVPEEGEKYQFCDSFGDVYIDFWKNSPRDTFRLASGNCHPTKEAAEAYAKTLLDFAKGIVK